LRTMLSKENDVEILAECADGKEALAAIKQHNPDAVFLDIQMPEMDGFEVLSHLKGPKMPQIIFVTAYDEYAVKAFEVHALDYLLKPFDRDRLRDALARIREQKKQEGDLSSKIDALIETLHPEKSEKASPDRLALKLDGRVIFVRPSDVDWLEAQDNYVKLHVGRDAHLVRDTLASFENRLDHRRFIRIARSTIVNIDRVREMQPMFHGEYVVILHDGTKLTMSRGYRETLQQYLGGGK
jgi:two-component system LytT family response regulator